MAALTKAQKAAPKLVEMVKLLEQVCLHEIKKAAREGDDEGARLRTITLHRVRAVLAEAGIE